MKQFYFLALLLLVSGAMVAQEKLSKEEQQRREKNIEAANPFAKFGYKAKVATLSKGKYLEVHDLDSIVTIGSVRFHVDRQEIVGVVIDTMNGEYSRPLGDVPSRWLSVDPLAEEFPSWSPYNFVYNNPLRYVDPDGRAAIDNDDLYINGDGSDQTLNQLQQSTSLTLSRDASTGRVTATGNATTAADKELLAMTTDSNVRVNVNSTLGITVTDGSGDYLTGGGSFDGSKINADGTATANQTVNPDFASRIDTFEKTPQGVGVLHETLEAYQEGKRAFSTQSPSGPANPKVKADYLNYQKAHGAADRLDPRHVRTYDYFIGKNPKTGKEAMVLEKPKTGETMVLYKIP
jgi:hypothetical protein